MNKTLVSAAQPSDVNRVTGGSQTLGILMAFGSNMGHGHQYYPGYNSRTIIPDMVLGSSPGPHSDTGQLNLILTFTSSVLSLSTANGQFGFSFSPTSLPFICSS